MRESNPIAENHGGDSRSSFLKKTTGATTTRTTMELFAFSADASSADQISGYRRMTRRMTDDSRLT